MKKINDLGVMKCHSAWIVGLGLGLGLCGCSDDSPQQLYGPSESAPTAAEKTTPDNPEYGLGPNMYNDYGESDAGLAVPEVEEDTLTPKEKELSVYVVEEVKLANLQKHQIASAQEKRQQQMGALEKQLQEIYLALDELEEDSADYLKLSQEKDALSLKREKLANDYMNAQTNPYVEENLLFVQYFRAYLMAKRDGNIERSDRLLEKIEPLLGKLSEHNLAELQRSLDSEKE